MSDPSNNPLSSPVPLSSGSLSLSSSVSDSLLFSSSSDLPVGDSNSSSHQLADADSPPAALSPAAASTIPPDPVSPSSVPPESPLVISPVAQSADAGIRVEDVIMAEHGESAHDDTESIVDLADIASDSDSDSDSSSLVSAPLRRVNEIVSTRTALEDNQRLARVIRILRQAVDDSSSDEREVAPYTVFRHPIDGHTIVEALDHRQLFRSQRADSEPGVVTQHDHYAGRDMQGIPWRVLRLNRVDYRSSRNAEWVDRSGLPSMPEQVKPLIQQPTEAPSPLYLFYCSTQKVVPSHYHFQLRHLVHSFSSASVLTMTNSHSIDLVNIPSNRSTDVFSFLPNHPYVSFNVLDSRYLFCGGNAGELIVKDLNTKQSIYENMKITPSDNAICNAITFMNCSPAAASVSSSTQILVSNNNAFVRQYDFPTMAEVRDYKAPWAVNYSAACPMDGKLIAIAGDCNDIELVDTTSGLVVQRLVGHLDFSFTLSWHPLRPEVLATASQDHTARIWDLRQPRESALIMGATLAPFRSAQYSHDGRILALAESVDYLHFIDAAGNYQTKTTIDVFGEINGVSFSPDDNSLTMGVGDGQYGCLAQFHRTEPSALDDFMFQL
jgi:WD40 repeat protein